MSYSTIPGSISTVLNRSTADWASWISVGTAFQQRLDKRIGRYRDEYYAALVDLFFHHRPRQLDGPIQVTSQRPILRHEDIDHRDRGSGVPLPHGNISNLSQQFQPVFA
jgi:hypothetical protein